MQAEGPRTSILVVDDHPANLVAIEVALGDLAGQVVKAQSGDAALRFLLDRDFAVILLDIRMPYMDGFETARFIRERPRSRHTPILFMTAASRDDGEALAAYHLGAADFLSKPIIPAVLRAKVRVFVDLHERTQELIRQAQRIREHEQHELRRRTEDARERWQAKAMRQRMARMAEVDRRKDRFLGVLSHELRTPLTSITLAVALLRSRMASLSEVEVDHTTQQTANILDRQAKHLSRLIEDLLDVSRINAGKIGLRKGRVAIVDVVEQAVAISRPLIQERGHDLCVELPVSPVWVNGDLVRLVQVVSNLLNNAARYTDPGGRIELRCTHDDERLELRVRDNGRGIGSKVLGSIFEPFVQERAAASPGLGLGLSIVKELVEQHDGEVTAASEGASKGAEFVVRLPLLAAEANAQHIGGTASAVASPRSVRPRSVVLIEDNDDIREIMSALLRRRGHVVDTAGTAEEGCQLVLTKRTEVALIDIGLPGADGYTAARRLRAELPRESLRLVAMTGFGRLTDRQRAIEAGFDVHLVKPVSSEALNEALDA